MVPDCVENDGDDLQIKPTVLWCYTFCLVRHREGTCILSRYHCGLSSETALKSFWSQGYRPQFYGVSANHDLSVVEVLPVDNVVSSGSSLYPPIVAPVVSCAIRAVSLSLLQRDNQVSTSIVRVIVRNSPRDKALSVPSLQFSLTPHCIQNCFTAAATSSAIALPYDKGLSNIRKFISIFEVHRETLPRLAASDVAARENIWNDLVVFASPVSCYNASFVDNVKGWHHFASQIGTYKIRQLPLRQWGAGKGRENYSEGESGQ